MLLGIGGVTSPLGPYLFALQPKLQSGNLRVALIALTLVAGRCVRRLYRVHGHH